VSAIADVIVAACLLAIDGIRQRVMGARFTGRQRRDGTRALAAARIAAATVLDGPAFSVPEMTRPGA
jgi:hypothetical protein